MCAGEARTHYPNPPNFRIGSWFIKRLELSVIRSLLIANNQHGNRTIRSMMLSRFLLLFFIVSLFLPGCTVATSTSIDGALEQTTGIPSVIGPEQQTKTSTLPASTDSPRLQSGITTPSTGLAQSTETPEFSEPVGLEKSSSEDPPDFPADLIYLPNGNLMRWDHINASPEVILDTQLAAGGLYGQAQEMAARSQVLEYTLDSGSTMDCYAGRSGDHCEWNGPVRY